MTRRVVFMSGTWDLLHEGHRDVLERAKALGDFLVVGVNTDEFVRSYKGEPAESFKRRWKNIAVLSCADAIVSHDSFTDLAGFELYKVNIRAVGPEFGRHEEQRRCLAEMRKMEIEIVVLPRTPEISTTALRGKM